MNILSTFKDDRYHPLWIAVFLFVGFFLNLGGFPLFDVDEGAFSEATREMLESGNWAATYLNGEPRYDKPIFTYWMQGLSVSLFGLNEIGLRLHSVIAAILWALAIYRFTSQFDNRHSALLATIVFATTFWISVIGKAATADAIFNLFICLTLFDIYRYSNQASTRTLMFVWGWMGLGVLTKGPVAILIPVLVSLPFYLSQKQGSDWLGAAFSLRGWALALSVVSPWLYFVWQDQGTGFFEGFILEHNLERFSSTKEGHGGDWYYYLLVLPLIALPYSGCLLILIRNFKNLLRNPLDRFLLLWFVVVFVLVSFSQTQLPHYVLYGYTPLVILIARHAALFDGKNWLLALGLLFFVLTGALIGLVHFAAIEANSSYDYLLLETAKAELDGTFVGALGLALISIMALLASRNSVLVKLAGIGAIQTLFVSLLLLPALGTIQQDAIKEAALFAKREGLTPVAYGINQPSFSVYAEQITPREASPKLDQVIFTRIDKTDALIAAEGVEIEPIFERQGIQLVRIIGKSSAN